MKFRPKTTILLILASIAVTYGSEAFDSSLYGVNGHPTEWLSFSPSTPLRHHGLPLLFAPFIHINSLHLFMNLGVFLPAALMIERKRGGPFLAGTFFFIHFLVLVMLTGIAFMFPLEGKSFLGSSHIVVGLYGFWSLYSKKYGMLFFALLMIGAGLWENQSPLTLLAHGLGLICGLLLMGLGHLRSKFRPQGAN